MIRNFSVTRTLVALSMMLLTVPFTGHAQAHEQVEAEPQVAAPKSPQGGNVIFFHPDGASLSHWDALRVFTKGPDGRLNWDELPHMAVYTGHMKDGLTGTSHGGATVHAYGVKVKADSFGLDGTAPINAASGGTFSIMREAMAEGRAVGVLQTGHIAEPGTAAFLASVPSRGNREEIARQVIESGVPVIMAGGEKFLLPKGVSGRHGPGSREDGLDLIAWAKSQGYRVVYTREDLFALEPGEVDKLLGVFASEHTFNDKSEEDNIAAGVESYVAGAPTIADMAAVALKILERDPDGFLLVAEEEGSDNLANANNARGTLEAMRRADDAVGLLHDYVRNNPDTLLLMTSDSNAGGLQVIGPSPGKDIAAGQPLPPIARNGAPADGITGKGSMPFMSAPDQSFRRWPFAVVWSSYADVSGGILARAAGRNAERVRGIIDNTDIYAIMYATLFGRDVSAKAAEK